MAEPFPKFEETVNQYIRKQLKSMISTQYACTWYEAVWGVPCGPTLDMIEPKDQWCLNGEDIMDALRSCYEGVYPEEAYNELITKSEVENYGCV